MSATQPDQLPAPTGVPAGAVDQVGVPVAGGPGLTARERAVLAFERQWWRYAGAKEAAIREEFGLSPTRYYQLPTARCPASGRNDCADAWRAPGAAAARAAGRPRAPPNGRPGR